MLHDGSSKVVAFIPVMVWRCCVSSCRSKVLWQLKGHSRVPGLGSPGRCACVVCLWHREKGRGQTGASARPLTEVSFSLHVEVRALWLEHLIILEGNLESNFHCPSLPGAGFLLALSTCPGFSDCPTFQPNWAAPHQISKSGLASSDAIFHFITQ